MRILVTGATGFVGQHLIPRLIDSGHNVIAVARDGVKAKSFDWYERVVFISHDIHQDIDDPFNFYGQPDALVHLAWQGLSNYTELFHLEEMLPRDYRFVKALVEGGVCHLLVAGTCLEYGMQNGCLSEDMPSRPNNSYALAKDMLRKMLEILIGEKKICFQWARLFYMHGVGQRENSLLCQLDRVLDKGGATFNMSWGEQLRDYLPVSVAVGRLAKLIDHPECSGIVNICSGVPISVRRVVEQQIAKRQTNIQLNLGYFPYPDYEPLAFWGDTHKFLSTIGNN